MVERVCLLASVATARGLLVIIEQPVNSRMQMHAAFQTMLASFRLYRKSIRLETFGGKTAKPLWLYSNDMLIEAWLLHLQFVVHG
eukprot:5368018-Alexandrium_andersonii.AAC.1